MSGRSGCADRFLFRRLTAPGGEKKGGMGGPTTLNGTPAAGAQPAATNAKEPAHDAARPSEMPARAALSSSKKGGASGTPLPASAASGAPSVRRASLGLAMMDLVVDEGKLRHVSSKDQLEAAFRKREVAVTALKAKMSKVGRRLGAGRRRGRSAAAWGHQHHYAAGSPTSAPLHPPHQDWTPEYHPHSIVPPTAVKGDWMRKTFMVSEPMILKVGGGRMAAACSQPDKLQLLTPTPATFTSPVQLCTLQNVPVARKTKIVCTLGPACWSDEGLGALMDAGMNVARFNFSHGDHAGHKEVGGGGLAMQSFCRGAPGQGLRMRVRGAQASNSDRHSCPTDPLNTNTKTLQVLDRVRAVAAAKGQHIGVALDTKGPEIRTAMLRGGKDILLEAGETCLHPGP